MRSASIICNLTMDIISRVDKQSKQVPRQMLKDIAESFLLHVEETKLAKTLVKSA